VYDGRTGAEADVLVSVLGSDYQQYPSTVACENGVCQEGRIKIDKFFTDLGIKWGTSAIIGYEAHSQSRLFKSAKTIYDFNKKKKNKLGLQISKPAKKFVKTNKKSIDFEGEVAKE
jgi:hypothetical protein